MKSMFKYAPLKEKNLESAVMNREKTADQFTLLSQRRPPAQEDAFPSSKMGELPLLPGVGFASIPMLPEGPPIQAFSDVGPSDDRFEHEAHEVAHQVESSGSSTAPQQIHSLPRGEAGLRGVHPHITASIDAARGSGQRLPQDLQSSVGQRLGADLSGVRIHSDSRADALNQTLNARAFTTGRDVFFRRGQYNPSSAFGRSVLTHELTHVVQQCGRGPAQGLGAPSQPAIQRFIMQIGRDDGYTRPQREKLQKKYSNEGLLQIKAIWDKYKFPFDWGGSYYDPKKVKYHQGQGLSYQTSKKLKNLKQDDLLRIVAHGSYMGLVGGYTGEDLAQMLIGIGLPQDHTAGIEIHACLPANASEEENDDGTMITKNQPTIVKLQDALTEQGYSEVVSGYRWCINPSGMGMEISPEYYKLFTDVAMAADEAKKSKFTPSEEQIETMNKYMGKEVAEEFLSKHQNDDGHGFYFALRDWIQSIGHLSRNPQLRHANSVRLDDWS